MLQYTQPQLQATKRSRWLSCISLTLLVGCNNSQMPEVGPSTQTAMTEGTQAVPATTPMSSVSPDTTVAPTPPEPAPVPVPTPPTGSATTPETTAPMPANEATTVLGEIGNQLQAQRDQFVKEREAEIAALDARIKEIEEKAATAGAQANEQWQATLAELQNRKAQAQDYIEKAKTASAETLGELRSRAKDAAQEVKKGLLSAWEKLLGKKESETPPTPPTTDKPAP